MTPALLSLADDPRFHDWGHGPHVLPAFALMWLVMWMLALVALLGLVVRHAAGQRRSGDETDGTRRPAVGPAGNGPADPVRHSGQAGAGGHARVLATDGERRAVVSHLGTAIADGCLTMEEGEERIGGAVAARYRHELNALVDDLPAMPASAPATQGPPVLAPLSSVTRYAFPGLRLASAMIATGVLLVLMIRAAFTTGAWLPWSLVAVLSLLLVAPRIREAAQRVARAGAEVRSIRSRPPG